ncbi:glycosyltransferase family 4 protein [Oscillochloris sp. ZM17-4]|uniref:glycosyltransferase family 4 protein n=1 Tax=Oscillochloris sp. ZM17-4 TaxID=2866714 RepID=UPI001C738754|nr:glycosyltransferase family 1 protein [Oscillochloris sp. ZM17-4]MBX0328721.1 glycosyltransferase family 4 protein [Oscillochloris sp. ZM17-4]
MRIGIDARYIGDHFPGIGRYIVSLAGALAELDHGHTLVLLHNPPGPGARYGLGELASMPGVELAPVRSAPFSPLQQVELPLRARALGLDLLHSPYFIKPYVGLPCPSVVTVYDLLGWRFPQTLSPRGRLLYRLTMGMAVRGADALITISGRARDELAARYHLPHTRVAVTPLAADGRFAPRPPEAVAAIRARYGLPEPYVLYLGSNKPHKNLERLVRAWELAGGRVAGAQLILAGHEDPQHPELRRLVAERGLGARVRFLPNVADADLPAIYSGAAVFAFVSYYEGFGLPPLEAMACGAPVLCARASSLPEVVGDAALLVDPYDTGGIAEGLTRLLGDPALRQGLRERGLRRAGEFSWRHTALGTLRVYEGCATP